jgi:outer membrane protein OmpA-like peptidoglycan-associated protein
MEKRDSVVKPLSFFSGKHEGVAGFIGDTMIVYRSARRRGDFYIAYPQGKGWAAPVKWKAFPNSRKGSEDALCEDPKTGDIIFSSDRKGTLGGDDLWITRRLPNGRFAPPENLKVLNTPYSEDAPFIVGDTLYFAHNGPNSIGGYDIFFSVRQPGGGWGKPQRLPRPFNTSGHDSYLFFIHPDSLYLSSDRVGGRGRMDLYLIVKEPLPLPPAPPPTPPRGYVITGRIYDLQTGQPVAALVVLKPLSDTTASPSSIGEGVEFQGQKPPAGKYLLQAYAPGYAQYVEGILVPDTGDVQRDIGMLSEEVLRRLKLPRLHFNFDKYDLRSEAPAALDTVLQILRTYPSLCIEIAGHTDSIGTNAYNQKLSERRSGTVYRYLIEQGIDPIRLSPKGYGEERPMVPNGTPYQRFLNRRVEFVPLTGKPESLD